MKTKLITVFLICFFANFYIAQTLIKTADFTMAKAANILKAKGYTIVEQEATFLKIKNKENTSKLSSLYTIPDFSSKNLPFT